MFGFRESFRRFMYGRYGNDKLNVILMLAVGSLMLTAATLSSIMRLFSPSSGIQWISYGMELLALALFGWALFRALSKSHAARQRENRAFLRLCNRLKDREHRYFACPKCNQTVRVPKGRGKIRIKCPSCAEQFIKRT